MNTLEIECGTSEDGFLCGVSMGCEYKSLQQLYKGWDDACVFADF